jgi:multidrug resistance efflux pump
VVELDTSAVTSNLDDKRTTLREAEHKLAQQLASLRATLAEKEFDVQKWRNDLAKAEIKAGIPRDLIPEREAQERDLELKRSRKELAKAEEVLRATRVGAAAEQRNLEIALSTARKEIVRAETALRVLTLTAPADGIVIFLDHPWEGRKMQVGDRVWVGMPIAKIPDLSTLEVVASLWDVDDGRVTVGDRATVTIDAYPEKSFSGRVVSVAPVAQEGARQTLRRAFRTVIALDRTDTERMRPGLSTKVVIEKLIASNTLLAPRHAIRRRAGRAYVHTTAGEREVVIGRCSAHDCAVLKGLTERNRLAEGEER